MYQHQPRQQAVAQNTATRAALQEVAAAIRTQGADLGSIAKVTFVTTLGGAPLPARDGRSQVIAPNVLSIPRPLFGLTREQIAAGVLGAGGNAAPRNAEQSSGSAMPTATEAEAEAQRAFEHKPERQCPELPADALPLAAQPPFQVEQPPPLPKVTIPLRTQSPPPPPHKACPTTVQREKTEREARLKRETEERRKRSPRKFDGEGTLAGEKRVLYTVPPGPAGSSSTVPAFKPPYDSDLDEAPKEMIECLLFMSGLEAQNKELQKQVKTLTEQAQQGPVAAPAPKAKEQKKRKRKAQTNRRFRAPDSMDKRAQARHDLHGVARTIFGKMITYHEEKERLNAEIRVKDISAERRSHLREELSNLLDVHDQIWYQKCLSDLQGINQALSGSAMQYTLPENFLTEASAADWRGYLESSEALLKSIDMQSQVAQPLDAIDDGGGDEEEEDENDNDENAAAPIGDEGSPMPDVVPDEGSSRVTSDNSTRVCIVCFTGPKKDLSAGGMDGLQIQCVACDNFVHLSCQGKCPQCHETLCRICLDEHVNGSCPAGPGIFADTGGNAVSRLVPSNVENDGTVTSSFEIAAKHSLYKPEFFDDNGLAKALRPRLVNSGMLKTVLDTLNETELATVKEEVANHVEKSDTIMLCMICNQPKRITMCFDCGTAELCATCMFNHGCMEPLCGYCGSRNLDSLIENSTCDACGRRDLCAGCLGAHCCEAVRDEVDEKHSDKRDHLVCLVPNPAERAQ